MSEDQSADEALDCLQPKAAVTMKKIRSRNVTSTIGVMSIPLGVFPDQYRQSHHHQNPLAVFVVFLYYVRFMKAILILEFRRDVVVPSRNFSHLLHSSSALALLLPAAFFPVLQRLATGATNTAPANRSFTWWLELHSTQLTSIDMKINPLATLYPTFCQTTNLLSGEKPGSPGDLFKTLRFERQHHSDLEART